MKVQDVIKNKIDKASNDSKIKKQTPFNNN